MVPITAKKNHPLADQTGLVLTNGNDSDADCNCGFDLYSWASSQKEEKKPPPAGGSIRAVIKAPAAPALSISSFTAALMAT